MTEPDLQLFGFLRELPPIYEKQPCEEFIDPFA
jgi:hypothetical protein